MTAVLLIAGAVAATLVAAVASGFENGIYTLSQIRLRYRLSIGDRKALIIRRMLSNPQRLLTTILILQSIVIYIATASVTSIVQRSESLWAEVAASLGLAVVFFIAVDAVPKNIFRRAADTLVYMLAKPLVYVMYVLGPLELALRGVTSFIRHVGAGRGEVYDPFFTRERLAYYLREGQTEGILSHYQVELTHNILRGERATVERAMVPMERVAAIHAGATHEEFAELSRQHRFSRYPVYTDPKDNIIGVLSIYDCLTLAAGDFDVNRLTRPAAFFARDVHVTEALRSMREARLAMGIVVDQGRAVGVVTMKDCMEEIVGELYAW